MHADLDEAYQNGLFLVDVAIKNYGSTPVGDLKLKGALYEDKMGEPIQNFDTDIDIEEGATGTFKLEATLPNVRKWTAETPYLYRLVLNLG